MDIVIGILLIVSFLLFAVYAMRGGNLMMGFLFMAILWAGLGAIAGVTVWNDPTGTMLDINTGIFQNGPTSYGSSAAIIIFGSWFGEILVETGIAKTLIRKAVELGGDHPAFTCSLLSILVAIIFCTAYGVGAVIAIGCIVFPILLSLGIPKPLAASSFLMAVGCGLYFNKSWFTLFEGLMEGISFSATYKLFAAIAFGVQLLATILMIVVVMRCQQSKRQSVSAWAAGTPLEDGKQEANFLACLTPLISPVLSIACNVQVIPSILIAVLWATFWTGYFKEPKKLSTLMQKTFANGVASIGLVLGMLMMIQMYQQAAKVCAPLLAPILSPIMPENTFLLVVIFALLAFLALFRGPFTVWGAGGATLTMMQGLNLYPVHVLFPLFFIPSTAINGSICPTQSWCVWAIGYTKITTKEYLRTVLPFALAVAFVLQFVAYFVFANGF